MVLITKTSLYMYSSFLNPECLVLPSLLPCYSLVYYIILYSLGYQGRQLLNQHFLVYVFSSFRPSLSRFPHRVNNSFGISGAPPLLRPPRSCPSPTVPGLWCDAWCDGLAGASGLAAAVAGSSWASPAFSRLPTHLTPITSITTS